MTITAENIAAVGSYTHAADATIPKPDNTTNHGLKSSIPDPRADYLFKIQAVGAESRKDKRRRQYAPADLVKVAAMHNLREIAKEFGTDSHIDVNRIKDNFIIAGKPSSDGVVALEHQLLSDAGLTHKIRKNAVRAIEIVFSLKFGVNVDYRAYFSASTKWASKYYGVPVLSSIVHLDESFPHCHVLLFPSVVDGRLDGNALMGDVTKINHARADFHKQVAITFGLKRQATQKRLSTAVRNAMAHSILSRIKATRITRCSFVWSRFLASCIRRRSNMRCIRTMRGLSMSPTT